MTENLALTYEIVVKDSLKAILHILQHHRFNVITFIKEFGSLISSLLFLFLPSIILIFIRWIKCVVHKRIEKIENDVDDLVHEIV